MSTRTDLHTAKRLGQHLAQAWRESKPLDAAAWPIEAPDQLCADAALSTLAAELSWLPNDRPQFWKSGGPARHLPLSHAPLAPTGVRAAPADFRDLRLQQAGVEAEIALRLGQAVTPVLAAQLDGPAAAALVDALAVSAELVSSRWRQGQAAPAWLRHADALSHGALALGPWLPRSQWPAFDWMQQSCSIQRNDATPHGAHGSHSLGDPFWGLPAWLRHATREGHSLPAGSVVTTGAWLLVSDLSPGDQICVRFEGLGEVQLLV